MDFSSTNQSSEKIQYLGMKYLDQSKIDEIVAPKGIKNIFTATLVEQTAIAQQSLLHGDAVSYFVYKVIKEERQNFISGHKSLSKIITGKDSNLLYDALEIFKESPWLRQNVLLLFVRDTLCGHDPDCEKNYAARSDTYAWAYEYKALDFIEKDSNPENFNLNTADALNFLLCNDVNPKADVFCLKAAMAKKDGVPQFYIKSFIPGLTFEDNPDDPWDNYHPLPNPVTIKTRNLMYPDHLASHAEYMEILNKKLVDYSLFSKNFEPLQFKSL